MEQLLLDPGGAEQERPDAVGEPCSTFQAAGLPATRSSHALPPRSPQARPREAANGERPGSASAVASSAGGAPAEHAPRPNAALEGARHQRKEQIAAAAHGGPAPPAMNPASSSELRLQRGADHDRDVPVADARAGRRPRCRHRCRRGVVSRGARAPRGGRRPRARRRSRPSRPTRSRPRPPTTRPRPRRRAPPRRCPSRRWTPDAARRRPRRGPRAPAVAAVRLPAGAPPVLPVPSPPRDAIPLDAMRSRSSSPAVPSAPADRAIPTRRRWTVVGIFDDDGAARRADY